MLKFYYIKMVLSEENAMNPKIVNEDTEFLCKVILNLNSVEECYSFLDDFMHSPGNSRNGSKT